MKNKLLGSLLASTLMVSMIPATASFANENDLSIRSAKANNLESIQIKRVVGDDYPYKNDSWHQADPWAFYKRECVSFVAHRINNTHKTKFTNNMKGGHFGNANKWDDNARKIGFTVNKTPKVGAVAQWNSGTFGHVAYVAEVKDSGKTIVVEEYNKGGTHKYGTRTISASTVDNFIHIVSDGGNNQIPPFPGRDYFKEGANNKYVTMLGEQLVKKGYGRFYQVGPGPKWSEADRKAVQAFQKDQGWSGSDADGYPGPETWKRLFS